MVDRGGVAGAVLAGGSSRRMGIDKATLAVDGEPLLVRAVRVLTEAECDPIAQVGGPARDVGAFGALTTLFELVPDVVPGAGPLAGIHAALHWSPQPFLAIVACDLPRLTPMVITQLITSADGDVSVADSGRLEPLCGVWQVDRCRPVVDAALDEGVRSVHEVLTRLRVRTVPVEAALMHNLNWPSDLDPGSVRRPR